MDETNEASGQASASAGGALTFGIRRDEVCVAVAILAELRSVPGTTAYQILVEGAELAELSVRETARLVVMSPSVAAQVALAS